MHWYVVLQKQVINMFVIFRQYITFYQAFCLPKNFILPSKLFILPNRRIYFFDKFPSLLIFFVFYTKLWPCDKKNKYCKLWSIASFMFYLKTFSVYRKTFLWQPQWYRCKKTFKRTNFIYFRHWWVPWKSLWWKCSVFQQSRIIWM